MIVKKNFNFPLFCIFVLLITTTLFASHCRMSFGRFVHVCKKLSWYEAQDFCRIHYTNLARFRNPDEAKILRDINKYGWIGLHRIPLTSSWRWSEGDMANLTNWDMEGKGLSGCVNKKGLLWRAMDCHLQKPFFCYHEKVMVLVKENKTWEEALEHCRRIPVDLNKPPSNSGNYMYDLASLTSEMDHGDARHKMQEALTDQVWTGLNFLAGQWFWLSGENWHYQDLPLCPAQWQHCGTLVKNSATYQLRDCMERRNFLCAMVKTSKSADDSSSEEKH